MEIDEWIYQEAKLLESNMKFNLEQYIRSDINTNDLLKILLSDVRVWYETKSHKKDVEINSLQAKIIPCLWSICRKAEGVLDRKSGGIVPMKW